MEKTTTVTTYDLNLMLRYTFAHALNQKNHLVTTAISMYNKFLPDMDGITKKHILVYVKDFINEHGHSMKYDIYKTWFNFVKTNGE